MGDNPRGCRKEALWGSRLTASESEHRSQRVAVEGDSMTPQDQRGRCRGPRPSHRIENHVARRRKLLNECQRNVQRHPCGKWMGKRPRSSISVRSSETDGIERCQNVVIGYRAPPREADEISRRRRMSGCRRHVWLLKRSTARAIHMRAAFRTASSTARGLYQKRRNRAAELTPRWRMIGRCLRECPLPSASSSPPMSQVAPVGWNGIAKRQPARRASSAL